jgi:menaquinone-dependent protoporphyrinogen oxidase
MGKRVLVAYASKYGATTEIAEKISHVLGQDGLKVDLLPIDGIGNLEQYSAFIIGSAVYMGQWRKNARKFLEVYEKPLSERPVWLFSSGPTGEGDPVQLMQGWRFPEVLQPIADHIEPRDIAFFHGKLDMKKLNFGEKLAIKGVKAPLGDFRDWQAVTNWATGIADSLMKER